MYGDAYKQPTHDEIMGLLVGHFQPICSIIKTEHRCQNGRIADIWAIIFNKEMIVEVKSEWKSSLLEQAHTKYSNQCDILIYACPLLTCTRSEIAAITWPPSKDRERIGIIGVDWEGLHWFRHPAFRDRGPHASNSQSQDRAATA